MTYSYVVNTETGAVIQVCRRDLSGLILPRGYAVFASDQFFFPRSALYDPTVDQIYLKPEAEKEISKEGFDLEAAYLRTVIRNIDDSQVRDAFLRLCLLLGLWAEGV